MTLTLSQLQEKIDIAEKELIRERADLAYLKGQKESLTTYLSGFIAQEMDCATSIDLYTKCVKVLQGIADGVRDSVLKKIEIIVSEALSDIYSQEFTFIIKLETQKNGQILSFQLKDKANFEYNILTSFGGGIKDIISTILRVIVVELHVPKITGPIILDETGRNISKEFQATFGKFLSLLSHKLGRQIILVSHQLDVVEKADKVIIVSLENKKSVVSASVNV